RICRLRVIVLMMCGWIMARSSKGNFRIFHPQLTGWNTSPIQAVTAVVVVREKNFSYPRASQQMQTEQPLSVFPARSRLQPPIGLPSRQPQIMAQAEQQLSRVAQRS